MQGVLSALAVLASTSGVAAERGEFMALVRTEVDRLNADLASRGASSLVFSGGAAHVERPGGGAAREVGAERLAGRVPSILARIEAELDSVDARIGDKMHILDADNDGVVSQVRDGGFRRGRRSKEESVTMAALLFTLSTLPLSFRSNPPPLPPPPLLLQEELTNALGFLRDQLGPDELRALLEKLEGLRVSAAGADEPGPAGAAAIDVTRLMAMADEDAAAGKKAKREGE